MGVRKQWPINIQVRQLELNSRPPRRFAFNLMPHSGFVLLVAAGVALPSSLIHPHLSIVLVPSAAVLYTLEVGMVQEQRKEGGVASPLNLISLVQGRSTLQQMRHSKYSSRRLFGNQLVI